MVFVGSDTPFVAGTDRSSTLTSGSGARRRLSELGFFSNLGNGVTGGGCGISLFLWLIIGGGGRGGASGAGGGGGGDDLLGGRSSAGPERMLAKDIGSVALAGFYSGPNVSKGIFIAH